MKLFRSIHKITSGGPEPDFTKTRLYALTDLATKVISAVALVALGTAGWLFQVRTEDARRSTEAHNVRVRLYLPALRSLNEAELVLDDVTFQLRHYKYVRNFNRDDVRVAYYLGNQVRVAASALFLPDGDPVFTTRLPLLWTSGPK